MVFALGPEQRLPAIPAKIQARVVTLDEVCRLGENQPKPHIPPSPQDVACLYYTSGESLCLALQRHPAGLLSSDYAGMENMTDKGWPLQRSC